MIDQDFIDRLTSQCVNATRAIAAHRKAYLDIVELDASNLPDDLRETVTAMQATAERSAAELERFSKLVSAIPGWVSADHAGRVVN